MIGVTVFKIPSSYPLAFKACNMTTQHGWRYRDTVGEVPNSGATTEYL